MFTGLIQNLGEVVRFEARANGATLAIKVPYFVRLFELGESVAVNGTCVTVTKAELDEFTAELSPETLNRTNLKDLMAGDRVNIEFPLTAWSPLGGHFVQGHIDTVGQIQLIEKVQDFHRVVIRYPSTYSSLLIEKGSIAVDGVSLTINKLLDPDQFEVMIIPHTWNATLFQKYVVGSWVNLEMDVLAKHIQRILKVENIKAKEKTYENFEHTRTH